MLRGGGGGGSKAQDTIVHASAADPYLVALTGEGQLLLLSLEPGKIQMSVVKANLRSKSKLVTICAYKDTSGLFTKETVSKITNSAEISALEYACFFF